MSGAASIDGRRVAAAPGVTILTAARRMGIEIPTLCWVEGLPPEGGCRLCLVEVDGRQRPAAACHTALVPGMAVTTDTPRLRRLRRELLELTLASADAERLAAARGTPLARLIERFAPRPALALPGPPPASQSATPALDASHPYLRFDRGLCVACRQCLEVCEGVQGQFVFGMAGRGAGTRLVFGPGERFADSDCTACGACVEVCPSGALGDRDRQAAAAAVELELGLAGPVPRATVESVCGYCGVGCRVRVETAGDRVTRIGGVAASAASLGHLCAKGRYAHGWQRSGDRLTRPLLRRNGRLAPVSWEEAISWLARRLRRMAERHGPQALGVLTSSRSTNEAAYLLQKLFRTVLETNNVDCCARVCHSSTALALQLSTGTGAASASYADLERARLLVVAGANPTEAHPVVGARLRQAVLAGAPLLVIDPRRIELAEHADLHLALRPGTNVALFNALAKVLLEEDLWDRGYAAERLEGLEELEALTSRLSLAEAAAATGVAVEAIRRAARLLAHRGPALFVHGLGLSELTQGTASVMALCNLGMLTGAIGRPGAGMLPLRGQNNVQGNADMGSMPNQVTGYQPLDDPEVRGRLAGLWGAAPPLAPGLTVTEMIDAAAAGSLRGLWIQGEDIAQSDPQEDHVCQALERLELLVVQELFLTETARRAHLVLPAAGALEQDGTFTNGERRVQRVRRAVPPPGEARPDWQVAVAVARALGADWSYDSPAEVMAEIARAAPRLFGGVSYDRLAGDGLQWPCPELDHPGTATVHGDGFLRGRGRLAAIEFAPSPEHGVAGFPFVLITGRVLQQYNVGTMTRRTPQRTLAPADRLEIHPADAAGLRLAADERVTVTSRGGSTRVPIELSARVARGTVFLSFHYPETHANRLVGPHRDPQSKCPDYKVVAVRLDRERAA